MQRYIKFDIIKHTCFYQSSGQTLSEHIDKYKYLVENVILERLESYTARNLDKVINHALRLKSRFLSFARGRNRDEKELRVLFIKNHLSELLSNAPNYARIFKTEKEDRTNKKHIEHINKLLENTLEIDRVYFLFGKVTQNQKGNLKHLARKNIV